ncbi:MAG TPA: spirocyclase AveC family protein [Acidimicrobiales bacterium]|jgi:hypothetical protein
MPTLGGALAGQATSVATGDTTPLRGRRAVPVKWWAVAGAAWIALTVYVWSAWVFSGHVKAAPKGPDVPPTWNIVMIRLWEVSMVIGTLLALYHFVIKPWRRDGKPTFDGLMVLAFGVTWMIQDPLLNYSQQWFNYSAEFVNLGCPQCHVPGWQGVNPELMAEPILFLWGMYFAVFLPWVMAVNWAMRKAKERRPELGAFGTIMAGWAFAMIVDFVLEIAWMRSMTYSYAGSIDWLTIFHGHYYQFPVYEIVFGSAVVVAWASLRYFKNDKGQSIAERGLERLQATPRKQTGLRFLAIVGAVNVALLVCFTVPIQWFATHADDYPDDIINRSYLTNMMCGPGTDYACAGTRVPIPGGPDSAHLTPEGELNAPAGVPDQSGDDPAGGDR